MANPTTTNLTASFVLGTDYATRNVANSARQFRMLFTGSYSGVTGVVECSITGVAGSYVQVATVREDTGARFTGNVGASNFSVVGNCTGYRYVRFSPSAITGTLAVTIDDGTNLEMPLGVSQIALSSVAQAITSSSANAFTVGANGTTNPAFNVDASAGSAATGLAVTAAAAAGGLALSVLSSGTNENLTLDAKGSGTITLGATSTGAIALSRATGVTGAVTVTSASASALTVGLNGATNPAFQVNAATGSSATGLKVTSAAAAGGLAVAVISSGTNEALTLDAKGSGAITIGGTSTGNVNLGGGGGRVVVPGTLTAGGLLTCALQVATSGPLIYSGSGAPSISAAVKGSIYLRTDGSGVANRLYVATDTAGTWTAVETAA